MSTADFGALRPLRDVVAELAYNPPPWEQTRGEQLPNYRPINELVARFHHWAYNEEFGDGTGDCSLRIRLHREELRELIEALESPAPDGVGIIDWLAAVAKELADAVYVAYGTAHSLGIPLDDVLRAVHRANMSKADADGNAILREDNKVLKGPNYALPEPEIREIIERNQA